MPGEQKSAPLDRGAPNASELEPPDNSEAVAVAAIFDGLGRLGEKAIEETQRTERESVASRERMHKLFVEQQHPREVAFLVSQRRWEFGRLVLGLGAALGAPLIFNWIGHPEWVPWWIAVVMALFGGDKAVRWLRGASGFGGPQQPPQQQP